jgi:tRNA 2-thiocytidine biosynthesis protein TtcA
MSISKRVFNCIKDYGLIKKGDSVAVGISGGKDSLALFYFLSKFRKSLDFDLTAVHIIPKKNYDKEKVKKLRDFIEKENVEFYVKETNILDYLERLNLKKDICFLCAHYRRKELFLFMEEKKIKKLALGHHMDDAIETFLMNIFYSAQTCTMMPKQSLFKGKIEIIRPFYTTSEKKIISFVNKRNIPIVNYSCGQDKINKRNEVKKIINMLQKDNKLVKYNIFKAMHNINLEYLPHEYN